MDTHENGPSSGDPSAAVHSSLYPASLSVLAVTPAFDHGAVVKPLLELSRGIRARGHRLRLVAPPGSALPELRDEAIPYFPVRCPTGRITLAGTLAAYGKAIYQALCAQPTHIIHMLIDASAQMPQAAALATFGFTLRHPCAPEPAIVTTIVASEIDSPNDIFLRARRQIHWLCDGVIVFSERAREAYPGAPHHGHLHERMRIATAGHDLVETTLAVYQSAWEKRQSDNRQALLPIEL